MKTKMNFFLAAAIMGLLAASSARADVYVQLDFNNTGNVVPAGWVGLTGNFLANTPTASINNINGQGYDFSIDNVGVYDNGNTLEPLTQSGFYTFGNNANDHNFTFSGLTPGETVALYACAAWDGNGRGGVIVYGNINRYRDGGWQRHRAGIIKRSRRSWQRY